MAAIKKGDEVEWKYGKGKGTGKVTEVHPEQVNRKIQGKLIKRNGSKEEPALVIKQKEDNEVIKSASEVEKK